MTQNETLQHDLHRHIPALRQFHSTKALRASPLYRQLEPKIEKVLKSYELVHFTSTLPGPEPFYRSVSWNIERGMRFDAILYYLTTHPVLSSADILLITEADLGMARSGNRHIAREIAKALSMHYYFAPSYLNLAKGCGIEQEVEGENHLGIAGNAILSRYPIKNPRIVSLPNAHDKMRGREKRLGNQAAPVADIDINGQLVTVAAVHLDVRSTQEHRRLQLKRVIDHIEETTKGPVLIGGDWNTSTCDAHTATAAIIGFWIRVLMGTGNMIRNHYPHPDRFFEKNLFSMLEQKGFDYKLCNELGVGTSHYSVEDMKQFKNLREWLPNWCFRFVEWSLKDHGGKCSFKLDWFTQRGLKIVQKEGKSSDRKGDSVGAKVIGNLLYDNYPASDHDAIVVDFCL
ncbi:MAG: endonuclease/exonuclease/phosphatase family protein [Deltaproteobacteria bacterium]|nr:endonuclease/exonuclease/phosphatase family protein [Deltaproteobacteria bacterium]MBI2500710.1 endonuclease/exonuclease/phosphatase family protein [Deltaproteobacteria bacterium]